MPEKKVQAGKFVHPVFSELISIGSVSWFSRFSVKPSFLLRNPIEKVAAFLETKHKDRFGKVSKCISYSSSFPRYKMFNLCSEKTYDTSFFHGRVERVLIDDHNVPTLKQMLEFADTVCVIICFTLSN